MKKAFTLFAIIALTTSISFAATTTATSLKSSLKSSATTAKKAIKTDITNTKNSMKSAIKADIENKTKAQASVAAEKKAQKIKTIDAKLTELNKQLTTVKNSKTITETQRAAQVAVLEKQIEVYNKQKAALQ